MYEPEAPFYILYKGVQLNSTSVPHLMRQFLRNIGFGGLTMSCNTSRHGAAARQYEEYCRDEFNRRNGADADCATLADHSRQMQLLMYNDRYLASCALAYVKLRDYAERERNENQELINRVRGQFRISDLSATHRNRPGPRGNGREGDQETTPSEVSDSELETDDDEDQLERDNIDRRGQARPDEVEAAVEEPSTSQAPVRLADDTAIQDVPTLGDSNVYADARPDDVQLAVEEPSTPPAPVVPPDDSTTQDASRLGDPDIEGERPDDAVSTTATSADQRASAGTAEISTTSGEGQNDEGHHGETATSGDIGRNQSTSAIVNIETSNADDTSDKSCLTSGVVDEIEQSGASTIPLKRRRITPPETETDTLPTTSSAEGRHEERSTGTSQSSEQAVTSSPSLEIDDRYPDVPVSDVHIHMNTMNAKPCPSPPTKLANSFEFNQFHKRREAKPIQDFPWLEVREIPGIGKGVFAKVETAKGAVVSDYRGLVLPFNEVDRMVRQLSPQLQKYMDSYLVEFTHYHDNRPQRYLVLAHDPVYKKAVTYGRLFNHSRTHPNLVLEDRSKSSRTSSREVNIVLVLRAARKIKAAAAASLTLAPLQPPPTLNMPWESVPSMSQHAPDMQLAPLTTRAVLVSLALRSDVAAMVIAPEPFDDVGEAYRLGRQFVLGRQEQGVESLVIPEGASQLCRLLNASVKDAFEKMHPVVLVLKRRVRDDKPLVLLIGVPLPDDSKRRYANCLVFVEDVGQTYIMAEQTQVSTAVHEEFANTDLVTVSELEGNLATMCQNPNCNVAEMKATLRMK
ncbi:hypothetical protein Aduo_015734 [Ancylostoma duodenale]